MPSAATPSGPVYDLCRAVPELHRLRAAAQAGDWAAIRAGFTALKDQDDTAAAARIVAEVPQVDAMLKAAINAAGDSPDGILPRTLLAYHHIRIGWAIRTGYRARYVSASKFARFHEHLRQAERLLTDVLVLDQHSTLARHLSLMTARGLQLGQAEARHRYDHIASVSPGHYYAQSQLLQQLCPKWSGSWEAAHAFADECREAAVPGGLGAVITVEAHLEHWMDISGGRRLLYWRRPGVRDSLIAAAEASVLHPAHRPNFSRIAVHSVFAAAFSVAGLRSRAFRHFEELGEFSDRQPWGSMFTLPADEWLRRRAAARRAARRAEIFGRRPR
ncbi:hypothetical protein ACIQF6_22970 [Kitasatospora sp. NPDC092948]|uniref:hypothetical protein n=1 Tax=Kitasatospora sp. NPDC092948 TaxID=3364088 RepID=UPI0038097D05